MTGGRAVEALRRWLRWARLKLRALSRKSRVDAELDLEVQFHLDMETEQNLRAGMSPAEARRRARVDFGGVDRFKEEARESRGTGWAESVLQDARYALRGVRRAPGHASVVILTVALGIAGATSIFSLVDGVLLRPLPFPEADRMVRVWASAETGGRFLPLTFQDYEVARDQGRSYRALGAYTLALRTLTDDRARPRQLEVARVSDGFFQALDTRTAAGRWFTPREHRQGAPALVISHELWVRRFGSDPDVPGRTVHLEGDPFTVVGVAPRGLGYPAEADLWRPLTPDARADDDREFLVVGRLADGVTVAEAGVEAGALAQRLARERPDANQGLGAWVQPLQATLVRDVKTPLLVLLSAVALVLLIACANVANLLLARGATRTSEMAVRAAMGAGRRRLARQLLTESLVLVGAGGAAGVILSGWTLQGLLGLLPTTTPLLEQVTLDGRVLAVAAAVTALCGMMVGLVPALQASTTDPGGALRAGGRGGPGGRRHRIQAGLVVSEVGLSTVVVVGAALLGLSFSRMLGVERGFDTDDVLVVPVAPVAEMGTEETRVYFAGVRERLARVPGVTAVGLGLRSPLYPRGINLRLFGFEGLPEPVAGTPAAGVQMAEPAYFETLAVPVLAGRGLSANDGPDAEGVAVVNASFARAYFEANALDPVGQVLTRPRWSDGQAVDLRIVGVVGDVTARTGLEVQPQLFLPFHQNPTHEMTALLRFAGDPDAVTEAVRTALWEVDPTLPLDRVDTVERQLALAHAPDRFNALFLGLFAGVALLLAGVGVYGVMSYQVAERSREMGLRRALGAPEGDVVRQVLARGVGLALTGVAAGLVASLGAGRAVRSLLYQVEPTHPPTLAAVAALLLAVALAACLRPALMALRADPMTTLRSD